MTLNAALDVTYTVDALVPHASHRVSNVAERAGGKGVNVARVLHQLGTPVLATGLAGPLLMSLMDIPSSFMPIARPSRRTIVIADGHDATGFWEPGPQVTAAEWASFQEHFTTVIAGASAVVLSGSLPPGVPSDGYAVLTALAHELEVPVVLDADGDALRLGVAAAPALVKPNADELPALGTAPSSTAVVASAGADGLRATTLLGSWRAYLREPLRGNPTGAGDACVAALARGLARQQDWPALLRDAVALSAAAVAAPQAGAVDLALFDQLHPLVIVEEF